MEKLACRGTTIINFGKNVRFQPRCYYLPARESELTRILARHAGESIRAAGARHSWNDTLVSDCVLVDIRHIDGVRLIEESDDRQLVEIGGGCKVRDVLKFLAGKGLTLPAYGFYGEQSIAGVLSTATHGSGRSSMSHYVESMRVAAFDPETGDPQVYEWDAGAELKAARCSVGCTGVILSVRIPVEPAFLLEQWRQRYRSIDEVLEAEPEYPRQQFYLVPWLWEWVAEHRRRFPDQALGRRIKRSRLAAWFGYLALEFGLNLPVKLLAGILKWPRAVQFYFRSVLPLLLRTGRSTVDDAPRLIMVPHMLFHHVEMELFVPEDEVARAALHVEALLRFFGGENDVLPDGFRRRKWEGYPFRGKLERLCGTYCHHYPITFRKVLADDTLISMSSFRQEKPPGQAEHGRKEAWYAISLITFDPNLSPFEAMADLMEQSMSHYFGARLHWGKFIPRGARKSVRNYPDKALEEFRAVCDRVDPEAVFRNNLCRTMLGFPERGTPAGGE